MVANVFATGTRPRHTTKNGHPYDYQTARGNWVIKTTRLPTVLVDEDRAPLGLDRLWVGGAGRDATKGRSAAARARIPSPKCSSRV